MQGAFQLPGTGITHSDPPKPHNYLQDFTRNKMGPEKGSNLPKVNLYVASELKLSEHKVLTGRTRLKYNVAFPGCP